MYHMLQAVMEQDGIRASDLALRLDIRPSSLTEQLQRAQHHGLITRQQDEQDSRAFRIHATQQARALLEQQQEEHNRQMNQLSSALTQEEAEQFQVLCEKLCAFLEAQQPQEEADHHHYGYHGRHHHAHRQEREK